MRVAVTETANVYPDMPAEVAALETLAARLDDVREANVEHHAALIASAAAQGAEVVGLGELFAGPYFALGELAMWRALAEDALDGPTVTRMRRAAREHGVIVVAPIYERDRGGECFNTAVVIDERGEVLGCYRKTHIPHGGNERASFSERFYYRESDGNMFVAPGASCSPNRFFPVFPTRVGRIGVAICYDRHFEGVMRALREGGAELVLSPAVTFGNKSQRMWRHEFPTDAVRHGLFIAGSNRRGSERPWEVSYFGDSYIVGPNGVLQNVSTDEHLVIADLPLAELGATDPSGWRLREDRRDDIY
jgi:N-carbamoylputrescine amidase